MLTDESGYFFWFFFIAIIASAVINATVSVVTQGIENGWDNIDWGRVAFAGVTGALSGALMASGVGVFGMTVLGGALGFASSVGDQMLAGEGINWGSVVFSTFLGALPGLMRTTGMTNKVTLMSQMSKHTSYQKAFKTFTKVANKLKNNMYATEVGAKRASSWAINNLIKVTNQVKKQILFRDEIFFILKEIGAGIGNIGFSLFKKYVL